MLSLGLVAFQGKPEPGVEDNLQGAGFFCILPQNSPAMANRYVVKKEFDATGGKPVGRRGQPNLATHDRCHNCLFI